MSRRGRVWRPHGSPPASRRRPGDAYEASAERYGQRPRERRPPDAGRPAETQDRGRRDVGVGPVSLGGGLTGHQVVERLVLFSGAADVFPVERPP